MAMKKKAKSKRQASKSAAKKQTKKSVGGRRSHPKKARKGSSSTTPRRRKPVRRVAQRLEPPRGLGGAAFDRQSVDLEGLSRAAQADSESVEELVGEGNVFEAGAVAGVQAADDQDTKEVRTREVLEDDVPDEYLEKD